MVQIKPVSVCGVAMSKIKLDENARQNMSRFFQGEGGRSTDYKPLPPDVLEKRRRLQEQQELKRINLDHSLEGLEV